MTFTVTYRGADGALREEAVEAAGRGECFAQMKARGILPVSVKEGARTGRRPDGGSPHSRNEMRPSRSSGGKPQSSILNLKSSIFLAAVLAVAVGAWWWLAGARDARLYQPLDDPPKRAKPVREAKPKPQSKPVAPAATNAPAAAVASNTPKAAPAAAAEVVISAVTNKSGYIVERVRNADGTISKRVMSPPPVFSNVSDQMIAMMLSATSGQGLPPMPANAVSDEEFRKSLEEPIEILDTDSPAVKDIKAKVIVAREDIKAMMKKGYSAMQVLQEHYDLFNDNAKLHTDALLEMKSILAQGDREGARKYAVAMNAAFQQMGVPEIPVPNKDGEDKGDNRAELARERARKEQDK